MKTILFVLALVALLCSGCLPLTNDNGLSWMGYKQKHENSDLEIGSISTRLMMENAKNDPKDQLWEEDLKESGFIIGIFYERRF